MRRLPLAVAALLVCLGSNPQHARSAASGILQQRRSGGSGPGLGGMCGGRCSVRLCHLRLRGGASSSLQGSSEASGVGGEPAEGEDTPVRSEHHAAPEHVLSAGEDGAAGVGAGGVDAEGEGAMQEGGGESDEDFSVGGEQPDNDDDDDVGGVGGAAAAGEPGAETVDCRFERIGDTNGVFYHLGRRHAEELGLVAAAPEGGGAARKVFVNPARTGRVRVLCGPLRCMCAEKLQGKECAPEDVLQRNVVGDEFWFPDGFFAIDLGNHTALRPTHYMMRNGGGKVECVTGWVLEGATHVDGRWWRVGDWETLDEQTNSSAFLDLADQVPGYTDLTSPPMKLDPRSGQPVCAIPKPLLSLWVPSPIGEKPHHTLCFRVRSDRFFRFFRLRLKTHHRHTHWGKPVGLKNLYVQGFELYGHLRVGPEQREMPPFQPAFAPAQWYWGLNDPKHWDTKKGPQWELQWLRDNGDQTDLDVEAQRVRDGFIEGVFKDVNSGAMSHSGERVEQEDEDEGGAGGAGNVTASEVEAVLEGLTEEERGWLKELNESLRAEGVALPGVAGQQGQEGGVQRGQDESGVGQGGQDAGEGEGEGGARGEEWGQREGDEWGGLQPAEEGTPSVDEATLQEADQAALEADQAAQEASQAGRTGEGGLADGGEEEDEGLSSEDARLRAAQGGGSVVGATYWADLNQLRQELRAGSRPFEGQQAQME